MTLNDHFALKSVSGSASNVLACSGFRPKLFKNLQSYWQRKNVVPGLYFPVIYDLWGYSHGFSEEEAGEFLFYSLISIVRTA